MKFVVQLHTDDGEILHGEGENVAIAMMECMDIVDRRGSYAEMHLFAEGLMILQDVAVEADKKWDVSSGEPVPRDEKRPDPPHTTDPASATRG